VTNHPAAGQTTVTEIARGASFVREHLVWFLGLLPLLFACFRVLIASGGNTETLKALVQNLDVTSLALATLLPFASSAMFWVNIVMLVGGTSKRSDPTQGKSKSGGKFLFFVATCTVIWLTMPVGYLIANSVVLALILLFAVLSRLSSTLGKALAGLTAIAMVLVVIIAPFAFAGMWLPSEQIRIKSSARDGQSTAPDDVYTGFVLSSDEVWTKFMDWEKQIFIVRSDTVLNRAVEAGKRSWWHRSLNDLTD